MAQVLFNVVGFVGSQTARIVPCFSHRETILVVTTVVTDGGVDGIRNLPISSHLLLRVSLLVRIKNIRLFLDVIVVCEKVQTMYLPFFKQWHEMNTCHLKSVEYASKLCYKCVVMGFSLEKGDLAEFLLKNVASL